MAGIFEETTVFGSGVGGLFKAQSLSPETESSSVSFGPGQAASPLAQSLLARQASLMGTLGVPEELANPDAARGANEAALAKLATINPELAQQLADQMSGDVEDKGLWGNLKDLAGDIMAPALAIGGKALDILSRPGRIVPELIMPGDDDPWYEDIGQALGGNSDATWSKALDKMGVDNAFLRGTVGFALDVATDPLTWVTFGGAGIGRAVLSRTAGTQVAEGFLTQSLREGMQKGTLALAAGEDITLARRLVQGAMGKRFNREAGEGIAAVAVEGVDDAMVAAAIEVGDHIARGVSTRTLGKMGDKVWVESLQKEVSTKDLVGFLKSNRSLGGMTGKTSAGALGGIRFRAFKYISPAIPGTSRLGFGGVSNFFRGYSGTSRLMRVMGDAGVNVGDDAARTIKGATNGAMASWNDFEAFSMGGWKNLLKTNPKLYHYLKGEMPGGSVLVPLSDAIGGITAQFTPHAWMVRGGGLLGHMAMQGNISARDGVMDFVTRWGYTLRDDNGRIVKSQRHVLKALDKVKTVDVEKQKAMRWFIDATPDSVGDDLSNLDTWFDEVVDGLDEEAVERFAARRDAIRSKFDSFSDEEKDAVWTIKKLLGQHRDFANKAGARLRDVTSPMSHVAVAVRDQADDYVKDGHAAARGVDLYYVPEGNEYALLKQNGFSNPQSLKSSGGLGRGLVLTDNVSGERVLRTEVTEDAVPVAVRLENPLVIDHRPGSSTEEGILNELKGQADSAVRQDPDKYAIGIDPDDYEEIVVQKVDEMITEALKNQGRDGVVEIAEDGTRKVVVFDSSDLIAKAKVIDNEVGERAVQTQGYYGRRFSQEFSEWMDGVIGDNDTLGKVFREEQRRAYLHMDIDEAEGEIRKRLQQKLSGLVDSLSGSEKNQIQKALADLENLDVYTVNPIDGLHRYVEHVGENLAEKHLANLGSRMSRLSKLGAFGAGGAVQRTIFQFIEPADVLKDLDGIVVKATKHWKEGGRAGQKALAATMRREQIAADEWARVRSLLTEAATPQRAKVASRDFGRAIARDIGTARTEIKALKAELKKLQAADDSGRYIAEVQDDIIDAEERIRDLMSLAKGKDQMSLMSNHVSKAMREEVEKSGRSDDFILRQAERSAARIAKSEHRVARWEARIQESVNEVNRLKTRYSTVAKDMKPAFKQVTEGEGVPKGWKRLTVKGLEDSAMPAVIAEEFESIIRKRGLGGVHRQVRDVMNVWKRFSTIYWPGFHVRNNYGALFNNILGGVTAEDYKWALQIRRSLSLVDNKRNTSSLGAAKTMMPDAVVDQYGLRYLVGDVLRASGEAGKSGVRLDEVGGLISSSGVTGANVLHDTARLVEEGQKAIAPGIVKTGAVRDAAGKVTKPVKAAGKGYAHAMAEITDLTENVHRTAMFLAGLRQNAGDVYSARMATMMRHGDYADLTDFEYKVVKDIMPFYKWMRTNLPYQFHTLIENPAKHLTAVKLGNAAFTTQGLDPDEEKAKMPEWLRQGFAIPNPFDKNKRDGMSYLVADLPMADLHVGFNEFLSSFLPTVRPFIESYGVEKSFFTKAPLEGKMVPLAAWARMPVISDFMVAAGLAEEKDGEIFINDKVENIIQVVPFYARFRNWALADPKRVKNRYNTIASVFLGAQTRTIDDEDLTVQERAFYYNEILPAISRYQDMGVQFPSIDEVSAFTYSSLGFSQPTKDE